MEDYLSLWAVSFTILGAVLSVAKGFSKREPGEKFDVGQLMSSLIITVMTAFTMINFQVIADTLTQTGWVGVAIAFLILGFGADQGLSKLDGIGMSRTKGGAWAREQTLQMLDGWISWLEADAQRTRDEIAFYEKMKAKFPDAADFFIPKLQVELNKTLAQVEEKKRYKVEVMSRPTWNG